MTRTAYTRTAWPVTQRSDHVMGSEGPRPADCRGQTPRGLSCERPWNAGDLDRHQVEQCHCPQGRQAQAAGTSATVTPSLERFPVPSGPGRGPI